MKQHGFPKAEHLKSKKLIEQLFKGAQSAKGFPVLAIFAQVEKGIIPQNQAGFSVSKKKFKRAVDRNLLKRRMREAYRLNKELLPASPGLLAVMFVYMPNEMYAFEEIEKGMIKALNKIAEVVAGSDTQS
jgi:ribonuclease P protein component